MKKKISIEALLRWAFNEELCKGQPIAASAWDAVERFGLLGVRVDTGHKGSAGYGFLDGTPHADAQAVARAISQMPKQSALPAEFDVAALGGRFAALLDDGARKVLKSAKFNAAALVIRCATFKNRPEWDIGDPELHPMIGANGQALVHGLRGEAVAERDERFRRARKDKVIGAWIAPENQGDLAALRADPKRGGYDLASAPRCLLSWESPAPFEFAESRAEYVIWRNALCGLAEVLAADDALLAHELTAEFPPFDPWNQPAVATPTAPLASARVVSKVPLEATPRRAPARAPLRYKLPKTGESRRKLTAADLG